MTEFPNGTVTFLFTDIEGSTELARQHPEDWPAMQARQQAILRRAIESHHGHVFQVVGAGCCAAFATAPEAIMAALDAQRALAAEPSADTAPLRVRMGLHTGEAYPHDGD